MRPATPEDFFIGAKLFTRMGRPVVIGRMRVDGTWNALVLTDEDIPRYEEAVIDAATDYSNYMVGFDHSINQSIIHLEF